MVIVMVMVMVMVMVVMMFFFRSVYFVLLLFVVCLGVLSVTTCCVTSAPLIMYTVKSIIFLLIARTADF